MRLKLSLHHSWHVGLQRLSIAVPLSYVAPDVLVPANACDVLTLLALMVAVVPIMLKDSIFTSAFFEVDPSPRPHLMLFTAETSSVTVPLVAAMREYLCYKKLRYSTLA